ncbi:nicotinate-nucleotide pyrophosphorylase [carboxylating]-like [Betta splendens]|uniref:Nicotinate-nucleotide pyrophosphorylase [carboxylating]-like n=1 Tax=Betta splendens TaxID=158456 RepID=A0A9W2XCH3_BETSP|nr:nicotinate-nucleotide pyrophosphorylase [carboxylating]-like [Betta splendens]
MRHERMSGPGHAAADAIPPHTLTLLAQAWLAEDTPNFDAAGVCVGSREVEARLLCKTSGSVLAGSPFFTAVFAEVGCTVEWLHQEGATIGRCCTNILDVERFEEAGEEQLPAPQLLPALQTSSDSLNL